MNRHSLFAWLRPVRKPTALSVALWALVLALSMLSFYVHLWRASVFRGEAAFALDATQLLAGKPARAIDPRRR